MRFSTNVLPAAVALASFMTREADAIYIPGIVRLFRGNDETLQDQASGKDLSYTSDDGLTYPIETPYNGVSRKVFELGGVFRAKGSAEGLPSGKEPRTMMGWIKIGPDYDPNSACAFGYGENVSHKAYQVWLTSNHKYEIDQYGVDDEASGIHDFPINTWLHIAATYDDTGKNVLYENGVNVGDGIDENLDTSSGANSVVQIGGCYDAIPYFTGYLADYAIFDRALSAEEVKSVFDSKDGLQGPLTPLTIEEKYSLSLVSNSTVAAFNKDSKDEEVKFNLKVADVSLEELDDAITILDYSTCRTKFNETLDLISATYDKANKTANEFDERYWDLPVLVDVDTAKFNTTLPNEYFTELDDTNEVQLKFCVKSELGKSDIIKFDANGNEIQQPGEKSSISYAKVRFDITINMQTGFTTDLKIEEENASTASKEVVIDYGLTAYECNDDNTKITDPPTKTQNSMVRICINTPTDNDVVIASIKNFKLKSDFIASNAIKDNDRNALTEVEGEGSKTVAVTTQMVSAFFSDLDPAVTDNTIDIEGTAVMEFKATGTRKLVRISSNNQKNGNVSGMDRKLDGDAGLGEFAMEVGISKSSSEANGAATSGASNALSATPLVTVTSLALGGVLMGTMF